MLLVASSLTIRVGVSMVASHANSSLLSTKAAIQDPKTGEIILTMSSDEFQKHLKRK